jgi:UDP-glucose 4-epimerase
MTEYSKVVVTGGAGFIGSHIVDRLLNDGFEVTVVDNFLTGRLGNTAHHQGRKDYHFVKGDIRDPDVIRKAVEDADAVFHEAALVSVNRSVENPTLTNEINVTGTLTLLKSCMDSNVKRFIYASSSSVYGETETLPKSEELACHPTSPYAVSKLAAENYVKVFHQVYGLETVGLRYFNVYGTRQGYGPYSGVITIFINQLLADQQPTIYGDGTQTRDFTNVRDVVEANVLALVNKKASGRVFNIATGVATSINELARILLDITKKRNLKATYAEPRLGDIKHSYADISNANKILGYRPKVQLREGLIRLVNHSRKALNGEPHKTVS